MLDIANVSKSAYYSWKNKTLSEKDLEIIYLITKIFYENKRKFGIRRIQMELLNKSVGWVCEVYPKNYNQSVG